MAVDVKVRMGMIARSICPCFRLCCSILIPLLPTPHKCLNTLGVRLSSRTAGGPYGSTRARGCDIRISPRSS